MLNTLEISTDIVYDTPKENRGIFMTKRYQATLNLVELRENMLQFPMLAEEHIHNAIIESLSKAQRELWYWIVESEEETVTSDVMATFNYSQQYASTLLNELYSFCLLEREPYAVGNGYIYRVRS